MQWHTHLSRSDFIFVNGSDVDTNDDEKLTLGEVFFSLRNISSTSSSSHFTLFILSTIEICWCRIIFSLFVFRQCDLFHQLSSSGSHRNFLPVEWLVLKIRFVDRIFLHLCRSCFHFGSKWIISLFAMLLSYFKNAIFISSIFSFSLSSGRKYKQTGVHYFSFSSVY